MSRQYSAITIRGSGPLRIILMEVDVYPAQALAGQPGTPFRLSAIWDTGATRSVVSTQFADRVGLPPFDFTQIHGAGGAQQSRIFLVDLVFPGTQVRITNLSVAEFVGHRQFDMLIGMDVITRGDFSITNAGGTTVFSFRIPPDAFHVDYVAMANEGQAKDAALKSFKKKQKRR